ncbi:PapD-like protein [Chlamydoabsidia padenii]|nr:PapD-like protein [Chlamydoabsidia padenii]
MSVVLDPPSQLVFKRPLTQPIEEFLIVKNVGTEPIAFKVKTTAPKQYCVRPNSGIIQPSSQVEVQVIFQPFKDEPASDFKCKDKFLVQTAVVKPDWIDWNMMELWSFIETTEHRQSLSQRKVKCVFLPPDPSNQDTADEPSTHDRTKPDSLSPTKGNHILVEEDEEDEEGDQTTPSPTLSSTLPAIIDAANRSTPNNNNNNNNNKMYDPMSSSISLLTAHTTAPSTKPSTPMYHSSQASTATPLMESTLVQLLKDEKDQLQQELDRAQSNEKRLEEQLKKEQHDLKSTNALVEQLQQQIKLLEQQTSNTLPLNNNTSSHTMVAAAHAMQSSPLPVDGYPPQVLLSVSALVFIFTYLFF